MTTYAYDPLGRRLFKETAGQRTWFGWDDDTLAMDVIDGQAREFIHQPDSFTPLAMLAGQQVLVYINDPNGCPTRLVDGQGQVKWAATHTALGAVDQLRANEVNNPIRLQGQYSDAESGLHYNRHRYYAPQLGAYISSDPITLLGGANCYQFGFGNPFAFFDPLGLECWSTARKNFWKSEAVTNPSHYSANNLARMADGKAPKISATVRDRLGNIVKVDVSMELHHTGIPQRVGGPNVHAASNLTPLTPWQHASVDPFRHTGNTLVSIDKGTNLW